METATLVAIFISGLLVSFTGYASAAYITALPLDTYRNDKRLVSP